MWFDRTTGKLYLSEDNLVRLAAHERDTQHQMKYARDDQGDFWLLVGGNKPGFICEVGDKTVQVNFTEMQTRILQGPVDSHCFFGIEGLRVYVENNEDHYAQHHGERVDRRTVARVTGDSDGTS